MHKNFKRKIHSRRGVSMLLALVLLLVCATVGAVALTAASASMGRYRANREAQQEYLAVMSAAELIRKDLEGLTFQGVYVKEVTTTTNEITAEDGTTSTVTTEETTYRISNESDDDPYYTHLSGSELLEGGLNLSGLFYKYVNENDSELKDNPLDFDSASLKQRCTLVFPGAYSGSEEETEAGSGNAAYGIPAVYGRVTVSDTYLLTVELSLNQALIGSDSEDEGAEVMVTMVFQPTQGSQQRHHVSGEPAGSTEDTEAEGNKKKDYYYYGSKVTWSSPVISKGAVANETEAETE